MDLELIYDYFDEEHRLTASPARTIEFLTTTRQFEKFLKPGMRILDVGAGTGAYSLKYAAEGYSVTAVEPVKKHCALIQTKRQPEMDLTVIQGNALDLSSLAEEAFDLVLCLGPLYHLETEAQRTQCVRQVLRVLKPGGAAFFAFINNDMVFVTEAMVYNSEFLDNGRYDRSTFKVADIPFVFLSLEQVHRWLDAQGWKPVQEFAADGMAELLAEKLNALKPEPFQSWLEFHMAMCEKPQMLGASNHVVFRLNK